MFSKKPPTPDRSPEAIPDTITGPAGNGSLLSGRLPTQPATRPAHRAAVERDRRGHQRAIARARSVRQSEAKAGETQKRAAKADDDSKHGARNGERLDKARKQLEEPSRRGRFTLGDTVSLGLIVIVVGVAVGAILGALGAAGWIVGLLVATLTLGLSAALRHTQRQRPPQKSAPAAGVRSSTGAGH